MHLSFILFADAANISQEGKLNILGVFDAVHAGPLPAVHPRATVVVRLKATAGDAGTHPLTLRWVNPRNMRGTTHPTLCAPSAAVGPDRGPKPRSAHVPP